MSGKVYKPLRTAFKRVVTLGFFRSRGVVVGLVQVTIG